MPTRRLQTPVVPLKWRVPISVGLVVLIATGIVVNTVIAAPLPGPEPTDFSFFGKPGGDVLTGHWGHIFENRFVQAGVIELMFWGVPFLLGIHTAVGWTVFGIITGSLFALALSAVVEKLLRPMTPAWSIPLSLAVPAIAALNGFLTTATSWGHPAEIVIPLLWIISGMLARRGFPLAAAAVLASTTGWELWGVLGVPLLLLAPKIDVRTIWRSAVGGILMIALLFVPFMLLGPMNTFSFSWIIRPNTMSHLLFPSAVYFPWSLRLAQGILSIGSGLAVVMMLRRRPDAIWLAPLAICVVRLFTDPVLWGYYAVPPLVMILIGLVFAVAQRNLAQFVVGVVALNVLVDLPLTVVTGGVLLVLTVVATAVARRGSRLGVSRGQLVREAVSPRM